MLLLCIDAWGFNEKCYEKPLIVSYFTVLAFISQLVLWVKNDSVGWRAQYSKRKWGNFFFFLLLFCQVLNGILWFFFPLSSSSIFSPQNALNEQVAECKREIAERSQKLVCTPHPKTHTHTPPLFLSHNCWLLFIQKKSFLNVAGLCRSISQLCMFSFLFCLVVPST